MFKMNYFIETTIYCYLVFNFIDFIINLITHLRMRQHYG